MLIKQFVGFAIVGIIATAIDYIFFCIFLYFSLPPLFANLTAFAIASVIGFHFNTKNVFSKSYSAKLIFRYWIVQIAGLLNTSLFLFFLDGLYKPEIVKLIPIMVVPIQTFFLNKFLVFR